MKTQPMRILLVACLLAFCSDLCAQTSPDTSPSTQIADFSVWSQRMDLSQYVGKKYRLKVAIRVETRSPESFAVAFIRNEPPAGGKLAWTYMDNMMDRPVRDSNWDTYTLEYRVDKKAPWIGFGILAYGSGVFYYDDLQLAIETAEGQWTSRMAVLSKKRWALGNKVSRACRPGCLGHRPAVIQSARMWGNSV